MSPHSVPQGSGLQREFPYNVSSRLLEDHRRQFHRKGQRRNHVLVTVLNTSTSLVFSHLDRSSSAGVGVGVSPYFTQRVLEISRS